MAFLGRREKSQGDEAIMSPKAHGTSSTPVQENLRWGCDRAVAERICNFNRHYAEHSGYFLKTSFIKEVKASCRAAAQVQGRPAKTSFFDSNTGKPLFVAPGRGRSMDDFLIESRNHGWLSFRDDEVVWANVRILRNGEVVSVDGTHLGHNLPDANGPRHCINLVSVAGRPHPEAGHL